MILGTSLSRSAYFVVVKYIKCQLQTYNKNERIIMCEQAVYFPEIKQEFKFHLGGFLTHAGIDSIYPCIE